MDGENDNESRVHPNLKDSLNVSFMPMLYQFRVTPGNDKKFALQQPFATLFDNLIAVLWAVYGKESKLQIGINQLQWALEFLRCMERDYNYPASIKKIVNELEEHLIKLYAQVGKKIQDDNREKERKQFELDKEKKSSKSEIPKAIYTSYNETDILNKLGLLKMPLDPSTGEVKYLRELNLLGRRKFKNQDTSANNNKSSKIHMISALEKILNKTSEVTTKAGVQELIKELKVDNLSTPKRPT